MRPAGWSHANELWKYFACIAVSFSLTSTPSFVICISLPRHCEQFLKRNLCIDSALPLLAIPSSLCGHGISFSYSLQEMQNFTLPSDLPMTSRMMSKGIVCTTESDLKSMQLTFPELDGEESSERPTPSDKKNSPDQTKMPPLPPLIKHSRSRLSQIKKSKSCHLPSVPTVVASSSSLKWGKY